MYDCIRFLSALHALSATMAQSMRNSRNCCIYVGFLFSAKANQGSHHREGCFPRAKVNQIFGKRKKTLLFSLMMTDEILQERLVEPLHIGET